MGMPHDFQMPAETAKAKINSICQNVPVNTAQDWADEVVKFCRGEANMTNLTFLKQNNIDQSIVETSEHSPQDMEIQRKRKASAINKVKKKLKTEIKEEVKSELQEELSDLRREILNDVIEQLKPSGVTTKHEDIKPFKVKDEEIEVIELDDEDDSHGLEFKCGLCEYKASSQYSLQAHWARGCPGQAMVLYECGVCLQKFQDILGINNHWQSINGCWSGSKVNSPHKMSDNNSPDKKSLGKKIKMKTPRKRTPVKRESRTRGN